MRIKLIFVAAVIALPAQATACPIQDSDARAVELAPHYAALQDAKSQAEAQPHSNAIWDVWRRAPDAKAQRLLDDGVQRIRSSDFGGAQQQLTELTEYCPDYAEGWNQLAFAKFLDNDLEGALQDLEHTLELLPNHFAAIAGKGLTLLRQGRTKLGHNALRDALDYHPWMNERRLLPPEEKI